MTFIPVPSLRPLFMTSNFVPNSSYLHLKWRYFYYHLVWCVHQYSITFLWTFEVVSTSLQLNNILSISAQNLYARQEQPIFSHFLLILQYIQMSPVYSREPWFCSKPRCRSSTVSCDTNRWIYRNSFLHIHYQRETPNSRKIKTSRSLL